MQVQPIFFNRELVLFAARLQDYSHRLSRLVSLTPQQFCKSGDLFTMRVRLPELQNARSLQQARHIDVTPADLGWSDDQPQEHGDGGHAGAAADGASAGGAAAEGFGAARPAMQPPRHVKRLAFGGLDLEPEYLLDRLRHECSEMALPCQAQEVRVHGAEIMRMEVSSAPPAALPSASQGAAAASTDAGVPMGGVPMGGVPMVGVPTGGVPMSGVPMVGVPIGGVPTAPPGAKAEAVIGGGGSSGGGGLRALVHVMPEGNDGTYAISLMRLVGDTFEFHSLYRSLRDRLTDITVPRKQPRITEVGA